MNISNQIQIIHIPFWIKIFITIWIVSLVILSAFMLFVALIYNIKPDWVTASAYLFGIIFPITVGVLILFGSSSGETAIRTRTRDILLKTLPYTFQFIPEEASEFKKFNQGMWNDHEQNATLASVFISYAPGRFYADYEIIIYQQHQKSKIPLRVELNIKRANINFIFEQKRIQYLKRKYSSQSTDEEFLRELFKHSLAIETIQASQKQSDQENNLATKSTAYIFNPSLLVRKTDEKQQFILVATTPVSDDLVWNPAEKVFFAQDLMFMIKAFWQECPECFYVETST